MVKTQLVEHLILDGEKLLHELDRVSFPVEGIFWIHLPERDYWRLIIVTALVIETSSAAAYLRLNTILQGLDLTGVSLEDVSLLDPNSQQFQSLRTMAGYSSRLGIEESWVRFEDAVVYRWSGEFLRGVLTCGVTVDELDQFWNAERKLSDLPRLLIDLNGRQVTLRLHPQHRRSEDVKNLKQAFQIASHRHPEGGAIAKSSGSTNREASAVVRRPLQGFPAF